MGYPTTPDGRYVVVRGRLWRRSDPHLDPAERERLTHELMAARRAKGEAMRAGDVLARQTARARVDAAKVALGERGPVWWTDGAPDLTRHLARTGPYADWYAAAVPGTDDAVPADDTEAADDAGRTRTTQRSPRSPEVTTGSAGGVADGAASVTPVTTARRGECGCAC